MNVKVYTAANRESLSRMLAAIARGIREGHSLGFQLFKRDLKASVESSLLGLAWLFIPALAAAGIWILLNQQRVISLSVGPMIYPAYVLIGTSMWNIFSEALTKPISRYKLAMNMMVKLNFPRESLFLAALYDMIFSALVKLLVLLPLLILIGLHPSWYWLTSLFIALGIVFFGLAIGIFIAPIGVLFSDVSKGINVILPFIMFLTPVVYIIPKGSFMDKAQAYNPITPWIELCRSMIGNYPFEMTTPLVVWSCVSVLVLILGLIMMRIALPIIVERAGS